MNWVGGVLVNSGGGGAIGGFGGGVSISTVASRPVDCDGGGDGDGFVEEK